jgi:L-methionine (R)-S-oxide reductase
MTETTLDLRHMPREQAYRELWPQINSVVEGCGDVIASMATISCLLHHGLGNLWTGFYRVVGPELLRVGPYQGTLGCLEISFQRGVCGACARTCQPVVVADVHAFAGHIACDGRSRSEVVVPVMNRQGRLRAVLDLDSEHLGHYSDLDVTWLTTIVASMADQWELPFFKE